MPKYAAQSHTETKTKTGTKTETEPKTTQNLHIMLQGHLNPKSVKGRKPQRKFFYAFMDNDFYFCYNFGRHCVFLSCKLYKPIFFRSKNCKKQTLCGIYYWRGNRPYCCCGALFNLGHGQHHYLSFAPCHILSYR